MKRQGAHKMTDMGTECAGIATMKTGEHVYVHFDRLAVFQDVDSHDGIYTHYDAPITDVQVAIDWCNARLEMLSKPIEDEFVADRIDYYKHWTNRLSSFCKYLNDNNVSELRICGDSDSFYDDTVVFGNAKRYIEATVRIANTPNDPFSKYISYLRAGH